MLDAAVDDAGIPDDPRLKAALRDYFRWSIERMSAHPDSPQTVPHGMQLAKWSWDGPVEG